MAEVMITLRLWEKSVRTLPVAHMFAITTQLILGRRAFKMSKRIAKVSMKGDAQIGDFHQGPSFFLRGGMGEVHA